MLGGVNELRLAAGAAPGFDERLRYSFLVERIPGGVNPERRAARILRCAAEARDVIGHALRVHLRPETIGDPVPADGEVYDCFYEARTLIGQDQGQETA